ncbi:zinc-ribbon domain-containing protein [Lysinibacillus boronitolerans]|uniref:zinc-ribbon domain-containing protein n=1 Tax=Lysinibacillus boronitolerans TaxID=309788 RepID=UPI002898E8A1|nr:zinc-ribbon domain-containing protein [Bacillus mobilis]
MAKEKFKQGYLSKISPLLAIQFDEEKNQIKTTDIYITSLYDERPFHWKCPNCEYEWKTTIYSRLKNNIAWKQLKCGQCIDGLSYPQLAIRIHFEKVVKQIFSDATVTSYNYQGFEIDIVVIINGIEKMFCIEYDSEFYHKDRIDFDKLKNEIVNKKHYFIRLREEGLRSLDDKNVVEITSPRHPRRSLNIFDEAIRICFQLFTKFLEAYSPLNKKELKIKIENINELTLKITTKSIEKEIYNRLSEIPIEKQLSTIAPGLAKQFSSKNEININKISAFSNEIKLWECPINENHKLEPYPAAVNVKTTEYLKAIKEGNDYNGCPYCCGKSALKSESVKTLYPDVVEFLEYGLKLSTIDGREVDFFKVPINSVRKFPFACTKCHYILEKKELKTIQSLTKMYDNIQCGTSKFKSLCPVCHKIALMYEGDTFLNSLNNGKSLLDIAYEHKTSVKRVKRLIREYKLIKNKDKLNGKNGNA